MNNVRDNFKMNAIFRNQPHYTYYSESFNETHPLYFEINDIDRSFLCPEQQKNKLPLCENVSVQDPRTKRNVEQLVYDHTKPMKVPIFQSTPYQSRISYSNHVLGVKVLKQLQDCVSVTEDDITMWRLLERARLKEKVRFQKFVCNCNRQNKYQIIFLTNHLRDLYTQWYNKQCHILQICDNAVKYNTYVGMPHPKMYKLSPKEDDIAEIQEIEVMQKEGFVLNSINDKTLNFQSLKYNIEFCHKEYMNCQKSRDEFSAKLKRHFFNDIPSQNASLPIFYIPLDALIFLLTSGDYVDLPTEMLLEIKENEMSQKLIIIENPLPARNCGWHTNKQVIEESALALLSVQDNQKWFHLNNEQVHEVPRIIPEINGSKNESEHFAYKLVTVEEYGKTYMDKLSTIEKCNWLNTLTKWNLQTPNVNHNLRIYTPMDCLAALSSNNGDDSKTFITNNLNIVSLKLEYETLFGCEVMTKFELLREWFRLKLSKTSTTIHHRLNINNFDTIAQETLTCERLELQLFQLYQIKVANILGGLRECLKLLLQIPDGRYMMRFSSKFPQKLLLYQPSEEITKSTIHFHHLLQSEPSNAAFFSNLEYLPIATDICSRMHLEHNLLPCTFKPCGKRKQNCTPIVSQKRKQRRKGQKQPALKVKFTCETFIDRDCILQQIPKQKIAQEKIKGLKKRIQKRQKRKRRKKSKKQAVEEKQREEELLQEEMNDDRLLFSHWFTDSCTQISAKLI